MDDKKQPANTIIRSDEPITRHFFGARFAKISLRGKKRTVISLIAIVLIVATAIGLVGQYKKYNARNQQLVVMSNVVEGLSTSQKAQYYSDQGEYAMAEKIWQDQLAKTTDTPTKLNIDYIQSAIAVKFKNYKDAKKYADKALTLAPKSSTPYVALAHLAQAQGDKVLARQYWQQAIKFIDQNAPASNQILRDYQAGLDELK